LEQTAEVLTALAPSVTKYFKERAAHPEIGDRLVAAWQTGIGDSLGFAGRGR
jgi:serine/threonine-protein kinase HipA